MPENGKRVRKHSTVALDRDLSARIKDIANQLDVTAYDVLCSIVQSALDSGKIEVTQRKAVWTPAEESPPKRRRR